ncbi:ISL3 family transposase [Deinococcus multiflagellatus]|uniref:ISL3 family transposase n=1 Tax=Deinococcus multiflagellatus TaxID=1656887 RepID=A0ABW1ZT93_9DEIO|nr:ISL3 family transposase [Deinococcus multiflagellatus]MBZ9716175.1 ISL3 family transposase [Deinococcus multiflagellatus]
MDYQLFLPDPVTLHFNTARLRPHTLWLEISSTVSCASCPQCGQSSTRVHSRYQRVLKDLACFGRRVRLLVDVRRFFCTASTCPQRIFCERLTIAAPWQRLTRRLAQQVARVALDAGGECAARCLAAIGQPISADTLLRAVPQHSSSPWRPVYTLGMDDWAWRKGQRYGTILVDLDRHETIDLLPDREVATVVAWLRDHPEIRIITRDRSSAYQEAATIGAPQALQIADRWHLLKNLRETLERFLQRLHLPVQTIFRKTTATLRTPQEEGAVGTTPSVCPPTPRAEQRFQAIHQLKAQGLTLKQISAQTGYSKVTVQKYLQLTASPGQPRRPPRAGPIDAYRSWLTAQWEAGAHNATHLFEAVRRQGYRGGFTAVREWCRAKRLQAGTSHSDGPAVRCPSARALSWFLARPALVTHPVVGQFLAACRQELPWFRAVEALVQTGWALLSGQSPGLLRDWVRELANSDVPELMRFAVGLERDFDAVLAAVTLPWSNGQVEGQVNRLKTLKRGMYGRAGLNLLRARMTYRPRP